MNKPILILQTGDAAPIICKRHGNFDQMFIRLGELAGKHFHCVHVARNERLQPPRAYAGVVVTGSPAMVTEHLAWSENAALWLRAAFDARLPIFAVCYGHQLLAYALGGEVGDLQQGMEFGTRMITLTPEGSNDPLLVDTPVSFAVNLLHSQTVLVPPSGTRTLAYSAHDAHQILRYSDCVFSTQFHPEFDGATMSDYVALEREKAPTLPPQEATDTPDALAIMKRFFVAEGFYESTVLYST
ncbi:MAG: glutamine amidotransferase [Burkholderiales bacterium]|jgi:GMP synthase (glutamine-hydrolysing)|nr:glutamine amidotransferase [Burkholderiales bacterium]